MARFVLVMSSSPHAMAGGRFRRCGINFERGRYRPLEVVDALPEGSDPNATGVIDAAMLAKLHEAASHGMLVVNEHPTEEQIAACATPPAEPSDAVARLERKLAELQAQIIASHTGTNTVNDQRFTLLERRTGEAEDRAAAAEARASAAEQRAVAAENQLRAAAATQSAPTDDAPRGKRGG